MSTFFTGHWASRSPPVAGARARCVVAVARGSRALSGRCLNPAATLLVQTRKIVNDHPSRFQWLLIDIPQLSQYTQPVKARNVNKFPKVYSRSCESTYPSKDETQVPSYLSTS